MSTNYSRRIAIGMAALTSLCLGGCETTNYDEQIATINSTLAAHDGRIGALESKVGEHEARLAKVEKGKFNYQKVGEAVILFDTGSYALKPEESAKLDAAIERLKTEDRNAYIEVEGFADLRGSEKANRELGLRRAREVYNYIRDRGVALNRMMLFSQGEEHPVDTGLADNRGVVVTVVQLDERRSSDKP